jgi:hypothetical protein
MVWSGTSRQGVARRDRAWHAQVRQAWHGEAGRDAARLVWALARRGEAGARENRWSKFTLRWFFRLTSSP